MLDVSKLIEDAHPVVRDLTPMIPEMLLGTERQRLLELTAQYTKIGAPEPLAIRVAACLDQYSLLDISDIAAREAGPGGRRPAVFRGVRTVRDRCPAHPDLEPGTDGPVGNTCPGGSSPGPVRRPGWS